MVMWLTNTLFVVEGIYKTSIVDHMQPSGDAEQATHHSHRTVKAAAVADRLTVGLLVE